MIKLLPRAKLRETFTQARAAFPAYHIHARWFRFELGQYSGPIVPVWRNDDVARTDHTSQIHRAHSLCVLDGERQG